MSAKRYVAPEPIKPDKFYLRRMHPKEDVEAVIVYRGKELIVQLDYLTLTNVCRDATAFYFTGVAQTPWDEI